MSVLIMCVGFAVISAALAVMMLLHRPQVGRFSCELAISLLWTSSVVAYLVSLLGIAETQRSSAEQMANPAAGSDLLFGQVFHTASVFGAVALLCCAFVAVRQAGGAVSESVNFSAPAIALLSATLLVGVISGESSRTNTALMLAAVTVAAVAVPTVPVVRSIWHREVTLRRTAADDTDDPVVITERQ